MLISGFVVESCLRSQARSKKVALVAWTLLLANCSQQIFFFFSFLMNCTDLGVCFGGGGFPPSFDALGYWQLLNLGWEEVVLPSYFY